MSVSVEMRVTVPDKILDEKKVMDEIRHVMETKTKRELRDLFEKTTEGWSNTMNPSSGFGEVRFQNKSHFGPSESSVTVFTSSKKYAIVNEGSPAHTIMPRRAKILRFRTGYRAATTPRIINSRSPIRFGNYISAQAVNHPGFEGRKFDETIADQYLPTFERDIQEAVNRGAKK